jgi:dolichyl-phosphate-mannose--protein O-mannosyl transferase
MRVRSHRRNLVVWSSSAAPASRSGDRGCTRLARGGRIRWWLHTGALLTVIGVMLLARIMRARQRSASLSAGTLLTVIGVMLPSIAAFVCGMLVWTIARPWHA